MENLDYALLNGRYFSCELIVREDNAKCLFVLRHLDTHSASHSLWSGVLVRLYYADDIAFINDIEWQSFSFISDDGAHVTAMLEE